MAQDKTAGGLLPFGFQTTPGGKPSSFSDILYSLGMPIFSRKSPTGFTNVFETQFNKNLSMGRDPYTGFPQGWGSGQSSTPTPPPAPPAPPPTAAEPFLPPEMMMTGGLSGNPMGTDWRQTMLMALLNPRQG